jgi:hypothetical protein
VLSVYDAAGARVGTLLTVQINFGSAVSYPVYRDDSGHIWAYADAYGTLPLHSALLYGTADCSGVPYSTQVNVAGLIVQHVQQVYAVGSTSAAVTVRSHNDSTGSCVALGTAQVYSAIAIPLQPLITVPAAPLLPLSIH